MSGQTKELSNETGIYLPHDKSFEVTLSRSSDDDWIRSPLSMGKSLTGGEALVRVEGFDLTGSAPKAVGCVLEIKEI